MAKKAAKKTAKKTTTEPAVKKASTKKVAKKAATKVAKKAAKKAVKKATSTKKVVAFSHEEISTAAYYIYIDRVSKGIPGNEKSDWIAAERSLSA